MQWGYSNKELNEHKKDFVFIVPMRVKFGHKIKFKNFIGDADVISIPCIIDESRYKIEDNYKITLKPIHPDYDHEHFYIHDLIQLIEKNIIQVFKKES